MLDKGKEKLLKLLALIHLFQNHAVTCGKLKQLFVGMNL